MKGVTATWNAKTRLGDAEVKLSITYNSVAGLREIANETLPAILGNILNDIDRTDSTSAKTNGGKSQKLS